MKLEELMMREDSKLAGTCSKSAGTNLTKKNEIPIKIPELKRSVTVICVEFYGIPTVFPNQGVE
jgi:hypothetical protein